MQHTVNHARRFREASLSVSVRALTLLFGLGTLAGIVPLVTGMEPMAFFAPLVVWLTAATAWWYDRQGKVRVARWLITAISLAYVSFTLGAAPRMVVMAIGFPLAFLFLLLLHLVHSSEQARSIGWLTLLGVCVGCLRLVITGTWPDDWALATGAIAQTLAFGGANVVLARLGDGWQRALGALEEANHVIAENYRGAKDASEAKSRFLADMSHELRTPLNAILGYSELIEDEVVDGEMPDTHDLERIQKAGRHLLELVNQVLDLSRVEAGYIELDVEPVDLSVLCTDVAETLRPQADAKGTELVLDCDPTVPMVPLDLLRTRQVLTNLVANAVKFTDEGTVTLRLLHGIDDVRLLVQDTGIGISRNSLDRIFEPFEQAEDDIQKTRGGTGLGLAISRQLVREMGGELTAQSDSGQGSTFVVSFPRSMIEERRSA